MKTIIVVLVLGSAVFAADRQYQTGKLISRETKEITVPSVMPANSRWNVSGGRSQDVCTFTIRAGNIVYEASTNVWIHNPCTYPDWEEGDAIQFRLKKDELYLKRNKEKDQELTLIKKIAKKED